jgi:hypothetical protein
MAKDPDVRPGPMLLVLAAGYVAWVLIVLTITSSVQPAQRVLVAGPLLAIGALITGMGYLSLIRRRALRVRQSSLERMLELRRRERGG